MVVIVSVSMSLSPGRNYTKRSSLLYLFSIDKGEGSARNGTQRYQCCILGVALLQLPLALHDLVRTRWPKALPLQTAQLPRPPFLLLLTQQQNPPLVP